MENDGSITAVRQALRIKTRDDAEYFVDEGFKILNDGVEVDALRGQLHQMDMKILREMYLMAQGKEEVVDENTGEVTVQKTGPRSSNAADKFGKASERILNRYGGSLEKKGDTHQTMNIIASFPWEREDWVDPNTIDVEAEEIED